MRLCLLIETNGKNQSAVMHNNFANKTLNQARRTLFKTGTASVASKKAKLGVWAAL